MKSFAPWPAIPWPTLWEWEVLKEDWKKSIKTVRLMAKQGGNTSSILDALAWWLTNAFLSCNDRILPGSHLYANRTSDDWAIASASWRSQLPESPTERTVVTYTQRAKAKYVGFESLFLLATPESGLSVNAAQGILKGLFLESRSYLPDSSRLNQLRIKRMIDSGIPEPKARVALASLDRDFQEKKHPWLEIVGALQN